MNIWIMKMSNILAYLGNINVALYVAEISVELSVKEISVTPRVTDFQGYLNSYLFHSYVSACKTLII